MAVVGWWIRWVWQAKALMQLGQLERAGDILQDGVLEARQQQQKLQQEGRCQPPTMQANPRSACNVNFWLLGFSYGFYSVN